MKGNKSQTLPVEMVRGGEWKIEREEQVKLKLVEMDGLLRGAKVQREICGQREG